MSVKNVSLDPKNEEGATADKKTNNKKRAFVQWVKKIRQQYLISGLQSELGDIIGNTRYVCLLENGDAESIRIDRLERMMCMVGFDFQKQNEFYEKAKSLAESIEPISSMTFIDLLKKRYEIIDGQFDESLFKDGVSDKEKAEFKDYIFQLPHFGKDYEYGNNKLIDMQTLHYFWAIVATEWFGMQKYVDYKNAIFAVWDSVEHVYADIKNDEMEIQSFREKIEYIKENLGNRLLIESSNIEDIEDIEDNKAFQRVMNLYYMISLQSIKPLENCIDLVAGIRELPDELKKEAQPLIQTFIQSIETSVDSVVNLCRQEENEKQEDGIVHDLYGISKFLLTLEKQYTA